jgi:hypothetical protein
MKNSILVRQVLNITLLVILFAAISCIPANINATNAQINATNNETVNSTDNQPAEEPCYAGAITENMLIALNDLDYPLFSCYFDDNMKEFINENAFTEIHNFISERAGDYISKEYDSYEKYDEYAVVYYQALYSKSNVAVKVKVVFNESGSEPLVSGFWLDSTLLETDHRDNLTEI